MIAADIDRYRKEFKFLHIGLVQVAVKPLFRKFLNIPICLLLRDARLLNFDDSLLGILESNLAKGPVYFNCHPNFSIELALIYRVYYKLMKTTISPKAINSSTKGATMLTKSKKEHSTTFVPRMLQWDDILSNDNWKFESITEPFPIQLSRSSLESVVQFVDGSINLKFLRSNSFRQASSRKRMSMDRLSSSKTREEDDIYETTEVSE